MIYAKCSDVNTLIDSKLIFDSINITNCVACYSDNSLMEFGGDYIRESYHYDLSKIRLFGPYVYEHINFYNPNVQPRKYVYRYVIVKT